MGGSLELAPIALGAHYFGPEATSVRLQWRSGANTTQIHRGFFEGLGSWVLADTPGGRAELRERVDPALRDIVDLLPAADPLPGMSFEGSGESFGRTQVDVRVIAIRIRDSAGRLAGCGDGGPHIDGLRGRSAALRAHAARSEGGQAPRGDPVRGP
jgi:hypothetical protein